MSRTELMDARDMAAEITESLPDEMCLRTAIVAVGIVATSLIEHADVADRSDLVETFCNILRKGTRTAH
jgi:hypothetical protein